MIFDAVELQASLDEFDKLMKPTITHGDGLGTIELEKSRNHAPVVRLYRSDGVKETYSRVCGSSSKVSIKKKSKKAQRRPRGSK